VRARTQHLVPLPPHRQGGDVDHSPDMGRGTGEQGKREAGKSRYRKVLSLGEVQEIRL